MFAGLQGYSSCGFEPVRYTQIGENEFLWLPCVNPTPIPSHAIGVGGVLALKLFLDFVYPIEK